MDSKIRDEYVRWLSGFRWDYFVTPTFHYPKTQAQAVAAIRDWLSSKMPDVYAVVAYERGPLGGRLHCHALVGGIGRHALQRTHLEGSWRRGLISVSPYSPRLGGLRYILDRADDPDGLELIGNPLRYKPRKRGRRRGRERNE